MEAILDKRSSGLLIWASKWRPCENYLNERNIKIIMNTIEDILGMIATEAIEYGGMSEEHWREEGCPMPENSRNGEILPPMQYDLRLIRRDDGTLYWDDWLELSKEVIDYIKS